MPCLLTLSNLCSLHLFYNQFSLVITASPQTLAFHCESQELVIWFVPVKLFISCWLFFMTKVSKFSSPFLERTEWLSFASVLCSVWVLVLRSRGHLYSCLLHSQVLTGCFSLLDEVVFITGNLSPGGRERGGGRVPLLNTWWIRVISSLTTSPFVFCFHVHCWVSG